MAHIPEAHAQFEFQKMQLIGSLGAVAETMRNCATIAEQFAQLIGPIPYHPAVVMPNGPMQHMQGALNVDMAGGKRKRDGELKKTRKSKPKDPNAPKRPPSSYLLFQNEVRQELKAKNPNIPNNELLNMIAKTWNDMPREQKDAYENRQKLAKDQYMAEKAAYETMQKAGSADSPTVAPVLQTPVLIATPTALTKVSLEHTASSSAESSENEPSGSDSTSEGEDEEEEEPRPVTKKSKHPVPTTPASVKPQAKKEKKTRKTKA